MPGVFAGYGLNWQGRLGFSLTSIILLTVLLAPINPALQARYDALKWSSTINSVRSYGQAGAACGIDVRHPFFDTRLAEFSFAVPDELWIREGYPKWLLRRTMDGMLPIWSAGTARR